MTTVLISGWNPGFQKVTFTNLLKSELGLTLKPAKEVTDQILDGKPVELLVPEDRVESLLRTMSHLGVRCEAAVAQRG